MGPADPPAPGHSADSDAPTLVEARSEPATPAAPAGGQPATPASGQPATPASGDTWGAGVEDQAGPGAGEDDELLRLPPRIGRYALLRQLGEGGMGSVYMAYDEDLGRRVALKLLHPRAQGSESLRIRLQREAQALAQISHPNVVQIYDVGRVGARVFVAMELIEGTTLRGWAKAKTRTWREALALLLQAGEGLAAAHQVGLIHRDIKPDNILVGDDGRVRVADFGLARAEATASESGEAEVAEVEGASTSAERALASSSSALSAPLTVAGSLLGTPAYMAPEQHMRQVVDSRADIFSFCVVAFELLVGKRPFAGANRLLLARAIVAGEIVPVPRECAAPGWLLKVIRRGLASEPAERLPSMPALLAELRRDPARRRIRALQGGALGVALLAAGVAGAEIREQGRQACPVAHAAVAELWSPARHDAVREALSARGGELGPATWSRVGPALGAYVGRLHEMYQGTCEEHRQGRISDHLHDLTLACLERPRAEVDALVELLTAADQEITERAIDAAARLPDLDECADAPRLLERVAPPADPALAAAVEALRRRLDRIRAMRRVGSFAPAAEAAAAALAEAEALPYDPVKAEAMAEEGALLVELGEHAKAAERFTEALRLAEASGDDGLRLSALAGLLAAHAGSEMPVEVIAFLAPQALALVDRRGVRGQVAHGRLLVGLAETYMARGDQERAIAVLEEAVPLFEAIGDEGLADLAAALNDLAMIRSKQRRYDEAHALYQRSQVALEGALGPRHPYVGHLLNNEARAYEKEGALATARARFEGALAVWEPVYGGDHDNLAIVTGHLARVTLALDDLDAAERYAARSLAIRESREGAKARTEAVLLILARVAVRRGDLGEAARLAERSLEAAERRYGDKAVRLIEHLRLIAEIALGRAQGAAAEVAAVRAQAIATEPRELAELGFLIARARLARGDLSGAEEAARVSLVGAPDEVAPAIQAWLAENFGRRRR